MAKQERKADHIAEGYRESGVSQERSRGALEFHSCKTGPIPISKEPKPFRIIRLLRKCIGFGVDCAASAEVMKPIARSGISMAERREFECHTQVIDRRLTSSTEKPLTFRFAML